MTHSTHSLPKKQLKSPSPLFDEMIYIDENAPIHHVPSDPLKIADYKKAICFLKSYRGSQGTFNSYRREIEKLLHWSWMIAEKNLKDLKREDIEAFIHFCQKPPKLWIGLKKVPRFIEKAGERVPNSEWRPFVSTLSKIAHQKGEVLSVKNFKLSNGSTKGSFAILSSFYNYLLQDEYVFMNPVALIRQKSKFLRQRQGQPKIRRLSELQWQFLMNTALTMANQDPLLHERTLFILSALYSMYLRISELSASKRWVPSMNHFFRDHDGNWWFLTVGKGNKERQIAVSDAMLNALKRWRQHLNLTTLPSPADNTPLLPKVKGNGAIASITYIREIVQNCFNKAIDALKNDGFDEDAESLIEATVHWLRHTGISDDVKRRPREHVRDDAGHSSGAITDKYIDIELRERHLSAKHKPLVEKDR